MNVLENELAEEVGDLRVEDVIKGNDAFPRERCTARNLATETK